MFINYTTLESYIFQNKFKISEVDGRHNALGWFSHAISFSYRIDRHAVNADARNTQL